MIRSRFEICLEQPSAITSAEIHSDGVCLSPRSEGGWTANMQTSSAENYWFVIVKLSSR